MSKDEKPLKKKKDVSHDAKKKISLRKKEKKGGKIGRSQQPRQPGKMATARSLASSGSRFEKKSHKENSILKKSTAEKSQDSKTKTSRTEKTERSGHSRWGQLPRAMSWCENIRANKPERNGPSVYGKGGKWPSIVKTSPTVEKAKGSKRTNEKTKDSKVSKDNTKESKEKATKDSKGTEKDGKESKGKEKDGKDSKDKENDRKERKQSKGKEKDGKDSKDKEKDRKESKQSKGKEKTPEDAKKEEESPPLDRTEQQHAVVWLKEIFQKSVKELAGEYQPNQKEYEPALVATSAANEDDNRYGDIACLEKTRVKIHGAADGKDYIHANYVGPSNNPKRFICTQGPMDHTVEKFWQMVVNEQCEMVVMLCDFIENGNPKCGKYYPDDSKPLIVGSVTVKRYGMSHLDGLVITLLEVTSGKETPLVVRHHRLTGWPDHGVPASTDLLRKIVSRTHATGKPVVIHCSAGIGRTGTLVLLAMAQDEMMKGTFRGLWPLLQQIRAQRAFAVQNSQQYMFACLCLVDRYQNSATVAKAGLNLEKFRDEWKIWMAKAAKKKERKESKDQMVDLAEEKTQLESARDGVD